MAEKRSPLARLHLPSLCASVVYLAHEADFPTAGKNALEMRSCLDAAIIPESKHTRVNNHSSASAHTRVSVLANKRTYERAFEGAL